MATTRQRGRRPTPDERKVRQHNRIIEAAQQRRLDLERQLEAATVDLARKIEEATEDSVSTKLIGSWLISPDKPNGLSRQMVHKLVAEKVDGKHYNKTQTSSNGASPPRPAARKRPGPTRGGSS